MIKRLPPLNFVKVFEASARHLNLHRAAEELGVTPGAVSQQIRALEANLGIQVFERLHKKLHLTPAGQQLFAASTQVLQILQETVDLLPSARQMVRITAAPTLCTRWLVPRLSTFYERHPDVGILIDASLHYVNLADEPFDIAIRHARASLGKTKNELMFSDEVVAVCAPSLLPQVIDDISSAKLLCFASPDHWPRWFSANGLTGYNQASRVSFSHLMLALDAAVAGQGVALGALKLVEHDLKHGRLARLPGDPVATDFSYYVVARRTSHHVTAFADWIIEEAGKDFK
jgi:LysR family transcriptional regulator, glycine cleavage system transcriptional activator